MRIIPVLRRVMSKRKIMVGVSVLAVTFATAVLRAEEPPATTPTNVVRVGTYDSRAIAIAFYRSPSFTNWLADLKAKHEKAKAEGNQKRVAEFEVEGKASQQLAHKQGFSTAPVDDILAHIKDQLPEIAKKAGVGPIVSKWDKAALAKYKSSDLVDVTMALVDAFKPDDRTRGIVMDSQKAPPIPLEEAENIKD